MRGFLKNETGKAVFKLQRGIPVNGSLSFDDAYLTLGEKSGKKEGAPFVKWLKENHFPDEDWVFYKEEDELFFPPKKKAPVKIAETEAVAEVEVEATPGPPEVVELPKPKPRKAPAKGAGRKLTKEQRVQESAVTAGTIIEADIPQAKKMIEKTKSRSTLKRALGLANHFSHKEEHRRLILRRLEEVY
jgi:hypothetical protein